MGSLCSSTDDDSMMSRAPVEAPLVVWGDIVSSESRVTMTLLAMTQTRYEFQQIATPIDGTDLDDPYSSAMAQLCKEDWLEVPTDQTKLRRGKKITGRSLYMGNRD